MSNLTGSKSYRYLKDNVPYFPYSLIVIPVLIAVAVILLFFVFRESTMAQLDSLKRKFYRLENKVFNRGEEDEDESL